MPYYVIFDRDEPTYRVYLFTGDLVAKARALETFGPSGRFLRCKSERRAYEMGERHNELVRHRCGECRCGGDVVAFARNRAARIVEVIRT